MTTVVSGFGASNNNGAGTEFLSMLSPPGDALKDYDNTKPHSQQTASTIPQVFKDAMSVREEVYGEQGVRLEAEFDEDDARSWHWVVYASVAPTNNSPPPQKLQSLDRADSKAEEERRSSASATRLPVGTIRLVPPPHGPNKYLEGDKHPDADPPDNVAETVSKKHPTEAYIKLGRLSILKDYQGLGLSKMLINNALDYAAKNPEQIRPPPSPTTMELANQLGKAVEKSVVWDGLAMVHAQASVEKLWAKHGFREELVDEDGEVEISKEDRWVEEGIEHLGMWKRLKLDNGRL
jgi:predicted GNAT family N-acyltransferase